MVNRQTIRRKIFHLVLSGVLLFSLGVVALLPQPVSAAPIEQALSFDGIDDYVDCGNPVTLGETTFEWWMKTPHNWTAYKGIFDLSSGTLYTGLHMMPNTGKFYLRLNSNNRREFYNAPADLSGWHYYVLYIAGDGINDIDNATLEIDGVALTPGATVKTNAPLAWDKFILGRSDYGVLECTIDEVRISDIARTPAEIAASWNGGVGERFVVDGNTVALWHMDEGTGGTIGDETGINNGTIYGPAWVAGFPFPSEAPPEEISQIVFTNPERTVLVNEAAEMTIETQDGGSPVNVAADTTINLDSTSGTGEFSLSPDPWTPTTSVVISEGTSSATFYYKNSMIGTYTIAAGADPGLGWTQAEQVVTVQGPVQLWRGMSLIGTYFTIQEAIDNASDGDDIVVLPGTYEEQIRIHKQITVKSQDGADTTIIDAQEGTDVVWKAGEDAVTFYPAVWIQRDGVEFGDLDHGFTIRNTFPMVFPEDGGDPSESGVAILPNAPGCTIRGNTIEDSNPMGIFADVDTTIISQNAVSASIMGIFVGGGDSSILYNTVDSAYYGIATESYGGDNNISNNTFSNIRWYAIVVGTGDSQVTNNDLLDSQGTAIYLLNTSNAEVSGNYISSDATDAAGIYGIQVEGGNNHNIWSNDISYVLVSGITLNDTSDNNLSGNEIYDIYGYDLWGDYGGDAWWTREQAKFERHSVKMWTGEGEGEAGLEFPMSFPFEHFEMGGGLGGGGLGGGELYFWAYLADEYGYGSRDYWLDHQALLPTYQLVLDSGDNGVILEANTGCEDLVANEWLKLYAVGDWTNIGSGEHKPISDWIDDPLNDGARVVGFSVVYAGDADKTDKTMFIDGSEQEGMPIEPPKGIAIGRSDRNSVSGNGIYGINGVGILVVESNQNMLGDNNEIVENGIGIVIENSNENAIRDSLIAANYKEGILVIHSYNNQIIGNDIVWNRGGMSGIHLDGESGNIEIHANNIVDNTPRDEGDNIIRDGDGNITSFGVFKEGGDWVNASGNWWGDASGPYHQWHNPGGMGDAVSNEFVHFEPWATTELPEYEPPAIAEDGSLAMPRMTALLGMFMGDVGPEQSSLVVEAYDNDGGVGIAQVTVDLKELLCQMLPPSPIVIRLRTDNPPFNDERVRQAMSMAIDYDTLRSELGGYGNIVLNPEEGLPTEYNPQAAIALLADAGYGQGFQTEIYMYWHYANAGLTVLKDFWAQINVDCEIRMVDMGELIEKIQWSGANTMVCYPYGWGMIPMDKLEQWQNWLNQLGRSHLQHQGKGVYQYHFDLKDELINQLGWYLGENDIQRIMEKLTRGEFSIPVTVADWCGNESYGNIELTIVDIMQPVEEGWNLISTPVTLDDNYTYWEDIFDLGGGFIYDVLEDVMWYDSSSQEWGIEPPPTLKPLDTLYIYASGNAQIGIIFNREPTPPPMLDLYSGWNLVGLAIPPSEWDSMPVNRALVTVEDVSGLRGYSVVVSLDRRVNYGEEYRYQDAEGGEYHFGGYGWNFHQNPWVYTIGSDNIPEMSIGGGYWVFMEADDMLAGFSTTPVTFIHQEEPEPEPEPDTFIYATIGDTDSLDPAYAYDTASGAVIQAVYETLLFFDGESTTEFVPMLATEWNISPDGRTYRFRIRGGVKFHNGNDLTPEDVEYSFERGMVQDYGAGPQWMLFEPLFGTDTHSSRTDGGLIPLEEIRNKVEVDGDWVQFNLVAPYEPFLQILANTWGSIVDKEWCMANGDWDGSQASYEALNDPPSGGSPLQSIINGTGPFRLERWDAGVETVLVRNDNYWRDPASLEKVVIKVVYDWATRKHMLEAGYADLISVPRENFAELEGVEGLTVYKDLPTLQVDAFFFQFAISEESPFVGSGTFDGNGIPLDFFTDVNVRKGFAYAFDWETYIADALMGEAQQIGSPICEGLSYFDPTAPRYAKDLDKAEERFQEAGIWETGFTFTLAYNEGNLSRKTACEILRDNLSAINPKFNVNIVVMDWPELLRGMYSQLLPMFQIGWIADYPDAHNLIFPFMHSAGTFSGWQNYSNPEVDALIADGISAATSAERESIYRELDQRYFNDAPSFILAQPMVRRYFRSWVKGFYYNPVLPGEFGNLYALSKE